MPFFIDRNASCDRVALFGHRTDKRKGAAWPDGDGPDNNTDRTEKKTMQNRNQAMSGETRMHWKQSLTNFAAAIWVIATIICGPVMLMKFAYRLALGESNPAAHAAFNGVMFAIVFMMILGACIERKIR